MSLAPDHAAGGRAETAAPLSPQAEDRPQAGRCGLPDSAARRCASEKGAGFGAGAKTNPDQPRYSAAKRCASSSTLSLGTAFGLL